MSGCVISSYAGPARSCVALQALQISPDVAGMLIAQVTVLLETLEDDLFQLGRNFWIDLAGRVRLLVEDGSEDRRAGIARECQPACGHLVKYAAETEEVSASIQFFPARLLRGHVGGRAHRNSGTC